MTTSHRDPLPPLLDVPPRIFPPLDPGFRPPFPAFRRYAEAVRGSGRGLPFRVALEREKGLVSTHETSVWPLEPPAGGATLLFAERIVKFLLWSRGGWRIVLDAPAEIADRIRAAYSPAGERAFDVGLMSRVYERDFKVEEAKASDFPSPSESAAALGGHFDGFRVGFDLGASDIKVAAVAEGSPLFSAEIPWNPQVEADPAYHAARIRETIRLAASHLPRVDAIGGSAAGVYVDNQVRVASLFRAVPPAAFEREVKGLFNRLRDEWDVPFEVINDGEVTALAGTLSLGARPMLGLAMGSSQAGGFLDAAGHLPGWLDELAFVPVDLQPGAPADEWSGDRGVGATYFSQQAAARLAVAAGLSFDPGDKLPERLARIQALAEQGDDRSVRIFESIGAYLGASIPLYSLFYDCRHVLVLGRVLSGRGGEILMAKAREALRAEAPEISDGVSLHLLDEKSRRVGQAVAAASLPARRS